MWMYEFSTCCTYSSYNTIMHHIWSVSLLTLLLSFPHLQNVHTHWQKKMPHARDMLWRNQENFMIISDIQLSISMPIICQQIYFCPIEFLSQINAKKINSKKKILLVSVIRTKWKIFFLFGTKSIHILWHNIHIHWIKIAYTNATHTNKHTPTILQHTYRLERHASHAHKIVEMDFFFCWFVRSLYKLCLGIYYWTNDCLKIYIKSMDTCICSMCINVGAMSYMCATAHKSERISSTKKIFFFSFPFLASIILFSSVRY